MPHKNTKTALIVEDSPTQALHLENLLSENGLNTIWARDAEQGLHLAQIILPHIIISDIELPGMNGMQMCKYLKANRYTNSIPIILLTHLDYRETAKFGIKAEAINYIPKDAFSDVVLLETLRAQNMIAKINMDD
jgi:DNA-binding response OmpR family regulator